MSYVLLQFSDGEMKLSYEVASQSQHLFALLEEQRMDREMQSMQEAYDNGTIDEFLKQTPINEEQQTHILELPELKRQPACRIIAMTEQLLEGQLDVKCYSEEQLASLANQSRNLGFGVLFEELSYELASRLSAAENLEVFLGFVSADGETEVGAELKPSEQEMATRRRNCGLI